MKHKEKIFTVPNLLSLFRIALIPVIVKFYCVDKAYHWALLVLILSGLTDVADGIIARKFDLISDLGKILDPVADKLTQFSLLICLTTRYRWMLVLVAEFALKEFVMLLLGYITIRKKDIVNIRHIKSATDRGFRLTNGDEVTYRLGQKRAIIRTMADNMRYLSLHQ